jgi:serine/threonine protein kinase
MNMVGQTVLQYQFLEKLGSGGMGEIYKAQDTRLNRFVAIKVLPADKSGDPDRRRRFVQEAQAASALNHPNIITIHDIISEGDTQYLVMEFIPGKTLLDLIPHEGMRLPQVLQYGTQMADALATAHSAGIIHRDFKPANVMVTPTGLVKVLDFGLAKLTERNPATQFDPEATAAVDLTVEGSIMGTVSYMSPEQAEGKRVDSRSDIFSFGAVLYEMVTGRRAFHGDSGISTLSSVLRDDIKPISQVVPGVPPLLEMIIGRCLYKDPAARWQSMKEAGDALHTLKRNVESTIFEPPVPLAPVATAPSAPPPATVVEKRRSANDLVFGLICILIVLGAAVGGWWWTHRPQPAPPPAPQLATQNAAPETPAAAAAVPPAPEPTTATLPQSTPASQAKPYTKPSPLGESKTQPKSTTSETAPPAPKPVPQRPTPEVKVPVTIADALPFRIILNDDIPATAQEDDAVNFTAADGLKVGDTVVIAKGATVTGYVVGEVGKKFLGMGSKKMNFRLMQAAAVDGQKINIRAIPSHGGKGPPSRPFETGKGGKSKEFAGIRGTEYIGYTDGEQTISVRK